MVSPPGPGQAPGMAKMFEEMTGLPSPDKIYAELQRLNYNMETIQPDLHKLAAALDSIKGDDIRNLSAALNKVNVGDAIRILNEFNRLGTQIYERLWGKP